MPRHSPTKTWNIVMRRIRRSLVDHKLWGLSTWCPSYSISWCLLNLLAHPDQHFAFPESNNLICWVVQKITTSEIIWEGMSKRFWKHNGVSCTLINSFLGEQRFPSNTEVGRTTGLKNNRISECWTSEIRPACRPGHDFRIVALSRNGSNVGQLWKLVSNFWEFHSLLTCCLGITEFCLISDWIVNQVWAPPKQCKNNENQNFRIGLHRFNC